MTNDKELFDSELEKLLSDPRIIRLCEFPQHHGSNTLDHCVAVARRAFELAEKLEWKIDEKELARGAMLHDYYQYSIKEQGLTAYKHGTSHPRPSPKRRSWSVLRTRTWRPGSSCGLRLRERERSQRRLRTGLWTKNNIHTERAGTAAQFRPFYSYGVLFFCTLA